MIHRVHQLNLAEVNRILELIQKAAPATATPTTTTTTASGGQASGGGSAGVSLPGATGPAGPAGADGIANLDLILMSETEEEDIVMQGGLVVTDESGFAVTDTHVTWAVVTDDSGVILTGE